MQRATLRKLAALVAAVAVSAVLTAGVDGWAQSAGSAPMHVCPPAC